MNKIPSLRVSTSSFCNCRCSFCQVDGDFCSDFSKIDSVSDKRRVEFFIEVISRFWDAGVRHFSLTGGEPLLSSAITFEVADFIRDLFRKEDLSKSDGYLRLNTNGILLKDHISQVHKLFDLIKISLHSLDKNRFKKITSCSKLDEVLEGVRLLDSLNHSIRIHFVVTKENSFELDEIIKYCEKIENIEELKIFDLSHYSELCRGDIPSTQYWKTQFVSIDSIEREIKKQSEFLGTVYSIGGYGNPMNVYQLRSGLKIRFRNSISGAYYGSQCKSCPALTFCKDGHCNLEIGPNNVIKICRPKEGKVFYPGQEKEAIEYFKSTAYIPNKAL